MESPDATSLSASSTEDSSVSDLEVPKMQNNASEGTVSAASTDTVDVIFKTKEDEAGNQKEKSKSQTKSKGPKCQIVVSSLEKFFYW